MHWPREHWTLLLPCLLWLQALRSLLLLSRARRACRCWVGPSSERRPCCAAALPSSIGALVIHAADLLGAGGCWACGTAGSHERRQRRCNDREGSDTGLGLYAGQGSRWCSGHFGYFSRSP